MVISCVPKITVLIESGCFARAPLLQILIGVVEKQREWLITAKAQGLRFEFQSIDPSNYLILKRIGLCGFVSLLARLLQYCQRLIKQAGAAQDVCSYRSRFEEASI
jgi:hypothetical protein